MFEHVKQDVSRLGPTTTRRLYRMFLVTGMWAVLGYRFRRWVYLSRLPLLLRLPLKIVSVLLKVSGEILTNIEFPNSVEIGPGLLVPHTGYIIVGAHAKIGENCTITQGVTIGHARGSATAKDLSPVIKDRVYVGPGSAIVGPVTIGNDVLIGVGAIVVRSVPDRAVVVGNPARVISYKGSFDMISYPGMETDEKRIASLALARTNHSSHADTDNDVLVSSVQCYGTSDPQAGMCVEETVELSLFTPTQLPQ
jgi:serine O-acetyltransferase